MRIPRRWVVVPFIFVATVIAMAVLMSASRKHAILAARMNLLVASQRYPKFTLAQHMAVMRELQSEKHPLWRDLSLAEIARRLVALTMSSSDPSQPPNAPFLGNLTTISVPGGDAMGMERMANCSLTEGGVSYTVSLPTVSYTPLSSTPNYDQVLHSEAGLTTTGGHWPAGCGDPVVGLSSRTWALLGYASNGNPVAAAVGYDPVVSGPVIWTSSGNPALGSTLSVDAISLSGADPIGASSGNLTGKGMQDLVVIDSSGISGGSASLSVLLANADGSLQTPVSYPLPGDTGINVVIDDFNGDGILDLVASSSSFSTGTTTYSLTFLAGKGDGTFQAPESVTVTPPSAFNFEAGANPYYGLISADLLGNGKKDLVTGGGVVLLGNGNGTFDQSATLAFPAFPNTSGWGPNVVAADFNNDGKLDLAVNDGESIWTYLGNGDGTFNRSYGYATIDNVGYLYATDLDGDGNVDLYSGVASGGFFEGDKYDHGEAYALMGNGNGKFQGAPGLPFVFTGTNIADLNGDKVLDGIGVNATINSTNVSFTSYLGNGNGTFKTGPTLQISPITVQGNAVSFETLDFFGVGDTRGNGDADLVYLPSNFNWPGGVAGFFLATGNGDGSFNAPVFVQAPTFAPSGDFDDYETPSNLFVADVNGDGKADLIYSYSVAVYQTNTYEQGIAVQLSNGDGTFQAPHVIQTYSSTTAPANLPPSVVQFGDVTGNGKLDLFTESGALNSSTDLYTFSVQLYLGNGDGTFGSALTPPVADNFNQPSFGGVLGQIVIADMNGDGKPDLVTLGTASNGDSELAISLGNGDGTYQTPTKLDFAGGETDGYGLAVADFDGDGKLDVAVTGFNPPFDTGIFLGNGDGTVQTFTPSGGTAQPSEAINLLVYGPAQAANFSGSSLPGLFAGQAVLVNQASTTPTLTPTTTALSASATNITTGQNVTFTATVTASSTPAGSVTFFDGTTALATSALNASGVAIYSTSNLSVGGHSISAAYQGNSTFAASTSGTASVTVTAPALTPTTTTLSTSATSITTGQSVTFTATITASSTPSGTVTFYDGMTALGTGTLNGSGVTTYQTSGLSIGPHSITAAYQGDSTFAASTSSAITVTVTTPVLTVTTTKLTATATTVSVGTSVTFNVTVSPASGAGTPTGTITFMDGTTTLAMMSLSSGAASYSTGSLAVGAHPITAVYGGDANYAGSTSSAVTVTVQVLAPSFTIGALPQSGTVVAGATAQTSITVTPVNGFNQQVSFACSGVSNGVTCGFNPSTVTPSGSAASTTMSLATTTQSAVLAPLGRPASRPGLRGAATCAFLAAGVWWFFRRGKSLRWPFIMPVVVGLATFAAILAGCTGSGSSTSTPPPQSATYTITVTATAGSEMQTASYSLTVTN